MQQMQPLVVPAVMSIICVNPEDIFRKVQAKRHAAIAKAVERILDNFSNEKSMQFHHSSVVTFCMTDEEKKQLKETYEGFSTVTHSLSVSISHDHPGAYVSSYSDTTITFTFTSAEKKDEEVKNDEPEEVKPDAKEVKQDTVETPSIHEVQMEALGKMEHDLDGLVVMVAYQMYPNDEGMRQRYIESNTHVGRHTPTSHAPTHTPKPNGQHVN